MARRIMQNRSSSIPTRRRSAVRLVAFITLLALASTGIAMAATGYARVLQTTTRDLLSPSRPATVVPGAWQPPGCAFAPASTFNAQ